MSTQNPIPSGNTLQNAGKILTFSDKLMRSQQQQTYFTGITKKFFRSREMSPDGNPDLQELRSQSNNLKMVSSDPFFLVFMFSISSPPTLSGLVCVATTECEMIV